MTRTIGGLAFEFVGVLRLRKDSDGRAVEYTHRLAPDVRPNRFAAGPFCAFDLDEAEASAGVYGIFVADELMYVGECENLERRFGPGGYARIAARNCHADGQSTNCKINANVLRAFEAGLAATAWFFRSEVERKAIESKLVSDYAPPWNEPQRASSAAHHAGSEAPAPVHVAAGNRFHAELVALLAEAEAAGQSSLRVRSGDLHRLVGGYPGHSHQMPQCCRSMKAAMAAGDRVVESPPKGAGANLTIEYHLPRDRDSSPW